MTGQKRTGSYSSRRIFRAIWGSPGISRVDIAAMLKLDKSTVTNQVSRLIDIGLLEEVQAGSASCKGGRRPIALAIRKSFGRVVGIELQVASFTAVAVDLSGEIVGRLQGPVEITPENFSSTVLTIVQRSYEAFGIDQDSGYGPLLGVGVGISGLVDLGKKRIRYSVPLGISRPIDFGKTVADQLSIPCFVENDANCCAWGELVFSRNENVRNFLFALVEYRHDSTSLGEYGGLGVGFGIAQGQKVYSGAHGNAGEFRSALCEERGPLQFSLPLNELKRLTDDKVVLERAADELARNMAMLVNTIDFDRVYIGGDIETFAIDFPAILRRRLEENWMYPLHKNVDIRYSSLGSWAVAYGAAGMVLDRLIARQRIPGLGRVGRVGRVGPMGKNDM